MCPPKLRSIFTEAITAVCPDYILKPFIRLKWEEWDILHNALIYTGIYISPNQIRRSWEHLKSFKYIATAYIIWKLEIHTKLEFTRLSIRYDAENSTKARNYKILYINETML